MTSFLEIYHLMVLFLLYHRYAFIKNFNAKLDYQETLIFQYSFFQLRIKINFSLPLSPVKVAMLTPASIRSTIIVITSAIKVIPLFDLIFSKLIFFISSFVLIHNILCINIISFKKIFQKIS